MSMSKYNDLTNYNRAIFQLVGKDKEVLDVGCGYGVLANKLMEESNKVWGIDGDDDSVKYCKKKTSMEDCVLVDLNSVAYRSVYVDKKFDVIVFADVLEHLLFPDEVLSFFSRKLKKGGKIYISVPNVGFIYYRLLLLFGYLPYGELGVLDKTHTKLFTKTNIFRILPTLLKFKSLKTYGYSETRALFFPLVILGRLIPGLFAIQLIIKASK